MASRRRIHHGRASASTRRERAPLGPDSTPHPKEAPVSQSGNAVRRLVYAITKDGRGGTRWLRVGVAFVNRDGSENVYLDAVPLSGKLQIRDENKKDEGEEKKPPTSENAT